ncbi:hypothetical protein CGLO_14489 [Colletotrichum gloeosporioides Cg-14]|uniref:Uncharacterized protein n=1 Tax=Colletotrichum gloeosporioides (strain Cg-14) TaxID=1237896 RepID=T0L4L5_COLGC|nr:hypothetical protein CGLO_14489 [Colletotrichum gloeosporioides Cg-14]
MRIGAMSFQEGKLSRMKKQTKPLYGRFKKRRVLFEARHVF